MARHAADIVAVSIDLRAGGEVLLFLLLAAEGATHGTRVRPRGNRGKRLAPASHGHALFEQLRSEIPDELLESTGAYDLPDRRGVPCTLAIRFRFSDGTVDGFGFAYGSESHGPPAEIRRIVERAIALTESRYREHLTRAAGRR
jgi:hypothetical protein